MAWFEAYGIDDLLGEASGAVVLLIILYCLSIISFTYVFCFVFTNETVAPNTCLLLYILLGTVLLVTSIVLDIIEQTRDVNEQLKFMYRLFPSYCLGEGIVNLLARESATVFGEEKDVWDLEITGYPLIYMGCMFVGYTVALGLIEFVLSSPFLYAWMFWSWRRETIETEDESASIAEDKEVTAERERVQGNRRLSVQHSPDIVQIRGLRKEFGPKVAVKDLWFGVPIGQCFGFLGVNGAGKSTALKMVTGDLIPTRGTATLDGLDILTQQRQCQKRIGYCPQFDALLPYMSGRETLSMFASVKGIPHHYREAYVDKIIKRLTLTPYADKPVKAYSGGNKRKLSVGIALIGGPPIVFLDEPSTGMDPVSRRFMWDLISETLAERSVVLTTVDTKYLNSFMALKPNYSYFQSPIILIVIIAFYGGV